MPNTGISGTNNNKTINVRDEQLTFLVLTNSVIIDKKDIYASLYDKGASIHYLIDKEGFQTQFANENEQTFTNGRSQFRDKNSLNKSAVNVMLINTGSEAYAAQQKNKLKAFLTDFRERNPKIDLKIDLLGLGEVAIAIKEGIEGEGKIFPRHEAPGKIFWQEMAQELAEQGFGLFIPTTFEQKAEVCVSPESSESVINDLQTKLREYGYALEVSGKYDKATEAWVTRFNHRYVPDAPNAHLWSKASQINLDNVLQYIFDKNYAMTQNLQSSIFKPVASAPDVDTVDTSSKIHFCAA